MLQQNGKCGITTQVQPTAMKPQSATCKGGVGLELDLIGQERLRYFRYTSLIFKPFRVSVARVKCQAIPDKYTETGTLTSDLNFPYYYKCIVFLV